MSCIITHKGQKYSEEQFKEYFINNKQEFVTSIAKNKDVIDSFKRKMEGINFVFSQSPELASIGSKAQYLQYLSTIFPDSKVKDIVYHGTDKNFNKFDKSFINKNFEDLFYFYKNKINALKWKGETSYILNKSSLIKDINSLNTSNKESSIEDNLLYALTQHFRVNNLNELKSLINEYDFKKINNFLLATKLSNIDLYSLYKNDIENYRQTVRNVLNNLSEEIKIDNNRVISAIINSVNPLLLKERYDYYLGTEKGKQFKRKVNNEIGNKDSLIANEVAEYENDEIKNIDTQYGVKEPEQIHILGNKQDIEGFKKFVGKSTNLIDITDPIQNIVNKINSNFTEEDLNNQLNNCKI